MQSPENQFMTHSAEARVVFKVQPNLRLDLTAEEYRLLADLLLDYIGTDPVRNDQFDSLTQHLFLLAVRADRHSLDKMLSSPGHCSNKG